MRFDLISKSVYRKHETSKSSDSSGSAKAFSATEKKVETATNTPGTIKAFGTTKEVESTTDGTKKSRTNKDFFRQRRELKRRVKQTVQRYIKRALIQRKNRSLFT